MRVTDRRGTVEVRLMMVVVVLMGMMGVMRMFGEILTGRGSMSGVIDRRRNWRFECGWKIKRFWSGLKVFLFDGGRVRFE